jgi:hypothetical protein
MIAPIIPFPITPPELLLLIGFLQGLDVDLFHLDQSFRALAPNGACRGKERQIANIILQGFDHLGNRVLHPRGSELHRRLGLLV